MPNVDQLPSAERQGGRERGTIGRFGDFDAEYFRSLEGKDGWIALGQENCRNQRYFTVHGANGERLGIVGVYDTDDDQNLAHVVVDPRFRGQGLAAKFKGRLMEEVDLPFLTLTIATSNTASLRATEKLPGVYRVSDAAYEQEFQKVKYRVERQRGGEALSMVERRQLADVWSRVVLGGRAEAPDSDRQTPEEFRAWLNESLAAETAALAEEWGMIPDAELVERIRSAATPAERASLEVEYLRKCQELFTRRTSAFRPSSERSARWDSWPETMRASGEFNCAGAVLLGMRPLEEAGIKQWIGNPAGHVVNVAQLADGSWRYADFLNRDVRSIRPTEERIADVPAFALHEEGLEYRHMLLLDSGDAVSVVLDNLASLQHAAHEADVASDDPDVKAVVAQVARFPGLLDTIDLEPLSVKLGGGIHAAAETQEMQAESARVQALYDLSDNARIRAFRDEIGDRAAQDAFFLNAMVPEAERIHRFLSGEDAVCGVTDERVRRLTEIVAEVITSKAARGTELHRELVETFVAKLRRAS